MNKTIRKGLWAVTLLIVAGVMLMQLRPATRDRQAVANPTPTSTPTARAAWWKSSSPARATATPAPSVQTTRETTPAPTPTNTPAPTSTLTPAPSPAATLAPVAMAVPAPPRQAYRVAQPAYGINAALLVAPDVRRRALDRVTELGFNWVKLQIRWSDFEDAKGQYGQPLAWLDDAIDDAHGRGIHVLLTVVAAPDWARAPGTSGVAPPADPQDYADFLGFLADRYRGRVQAFEVWNEQNLAREWGGKGRLNVGQYVALLRAAYYRLPADVAVISGGLTPTGTDDGYTAIADRRYLQELYSAGLRDISDGIGAHASGYNMPPFADWRNPPGDQCRVFQHSCSNAHPSWVFQATLLDYRDIMVANGDGDKQIWVTEFGWASCEGGYNTIAGYEYCEDNTAWEQGEWLREVYTGVRERGWDWIGVMFAWNLNFAELNGPASEMSAFSILDLNGNPRHAFEALKGMPK